MRGRLLYAYNYHCYCVPRLWVMIGKQRLIAQQAAAVIGIILQLPIPKLFSRCKRASIGWELKQA